MPNPEIDLHKLDQLLRSGTSQNEIAKMFDVSPAAVSRAKKRLKNNIIRTVILEKANRVVESHLDMMGQLKMINQAINEELERAKQSVTTANGRDRLALQDIIIKLSSEIRRQLEVQLKIIEVWHDMKVFSEFQAEVLAVLDEAQPGVRDEIIRRLKEKRALRGTISTP